MGFVVPGSHVKKNRWVVLTSSLNLDSDSLITITTIIIIILITIVIIFKTTMGLQSWIWGSHQQRRFFSLFDPLAVDQFQTTTLFCT